MTASATPRVRRTGALTHRSLTDAVLDEGADAPMVLAVGSERLELAALRILRDDSPLGVLRAGSPAVVRDEGELGAAEWELRRVRR